MKIQPVRGTHDLFGEELFKYKIIESKVNYLGKIYDFNQIITPIFESTDLFKKPLGEYSDVVLKEMYTFNDRNNSLLTLRPEFTTPTLRAAISNNKLEKLPVKLYSIGPVFRRERPQKGRFRQFNQINFETLGSNDEMADVDLILLADSVLKNLLPNKKINLEINSLGDKNTLKVFKKELNIYFAKHKNQLSEQSKIKIDSNPLRILDSKNNQDIEINKDAPKISNYYSKNADANFLNIKNLLSENSINFSVNPNLVRGLDYYCNIVFEFKSDELGSQDTLIGGGRYDGLIKTLGGPDISGVGWAGGIERIIMLMQKPKIEEKKVHLIIMSENFKNYGFKVANNLRKHNIKIHFDYKFNIKKSLSNASQFKSKFAIIIGDSEVKKNVCILKSLDKNTQEELNIEDIIKKLIK